MTKELKLGGMLLVLCMGWVANASPLAAQEKLSLAEAIALTLEHNPDLSIDRPAMDAARSELEASRAGYFPRLDFEQSYTGGNNPVYVFGTLLSQRRFQAANFELNSLNRPSPIDNLQTRFTAQQTLWDGGRTSRRVESARLGVALADRAHEDHTRRVLLAVLDAYYSVSLAAEHVQAARVAVESAEAIVKQAEARVQSGLAVEVDLLRGRVFLSAARQEQIRAQGEKEIATAALNRLMGRDYDAVLGETASLASVQLPEPEVEALRAELRKNRPDYQRLLAELEQSELEVRSKRAEFLPVLGAFAQWEADNPSLSSAGGNNWSAGLSMRWNLFAGGGDHARLEGARHRLEQKRREVAAMESSMSLEIHRAVVEARSAGQRVQVALAAEAQSQESVRILRNRYDAGLATLTDLLSSESARAEARSSLAAAVYRMRLSHAQVEFVAGILRPDSPAMKP